MNSTNFNCLCVIKHQNRTCIRNVISRYLKAIAPKFALVFVFSQLLMWAVAVVIPGLSFPFVTKPFGYFRSGLIRATVHLPVAPHVPSSQDHSRSQAKWSTVNLFLWDHMVSKEEQPRAKYYSVLLMRKKNKNAINHYINSKRFKNIYILLKDKNILGKQKSWIELTVILFSFS